LRENGFDSIICRDNQPPGEDTVKKALVVYRSRTGVTRRYAEEIGAYLRTKDLESTVASVGECDFAAMGEADYLLLGCWTSGLFVVRQHPDGPWLSFVRAMPALPHDGPKVGLFTTYKLRAGSQLPRMRKALTGKTASPRLELKSRDGSLSAADRLALDAFVA
jgi:flavodoxin